MQNIHSILMRNKWDYDTAHLYESINSLNSSIEKTESSKTIVNHYVELKVRRAEELQKLSLILVKDGVGLKRKIKVSYAEFLDGPRKPRTNKIFCSSIWKDEK